MPQGDEPTADPGQVFRRHLRWRWFRALDYLSLFLYALVISTGALVVDYVLFLVIKLVVSDAVAGYPVVTVWFDWFQIGSAFLVFIVAFIHAIFSAYSQIRFEIETAKQQEGQ